LLDATNAHDLDALVGCFAPDYVNETPVHPARGFVGSEQVRRNWEQILGNISDLKATVSAQVVAADEVWSEWQMSGTRPDGSAHLMRGVIIFTVHDGRAARARFYLEPVDVGVTGVDAAVREVVEPTP
jgi:ketosteroid isomerase-like protein